MPAPISDALKAHLAQPATTVARILRVVRRDGVVHRWTSHDRELTLEAGDMAGTYRRGVGFVASAVESRDDLSASNADLVALIRDGQITETDIGAGRLDSAEATLALVNWADLSQGVLIRAHGRLGEVTPSTTGTWRAELRGLAQALAEQTVQVITPNCTAEFASTAEEARVSCGVDRAAFRHDVTVAADPAPTRQAFTVTGYDARADDALTAEEYDPEVEGRPVQTWQPSPWYAGGRATFLTGANAGFRVEVKGNEGGALTLYKPAPFDVAAGDTLELIAGCDKSILTCRLRFDNSPGFRGFPFVDSGILLRIGGRT